LIGACIAVVVVVVGEVSEAGLAGVVDTFAEIVIAGLCGLDKKEEWDYPNLKHYKNIQLKWAQSN